MRPHEWRVRCSRSTTSARPYESSAGARGTRSGWMRRTSRPPMSLPSSRLSTNTLPAFPGDGIGVEHRADGEPDQDVDRAAEAPVRERGGALADVEDEHRRGL